MLGKDKWYRVLMPPIIVSAGASFGLGALTAARAKPLADLETKSLPGFSGVAELPVPGLSFLWRYDSTLGKGFSEPLRPRSWGVGFQLDVLKLVGGWKPSPPLPRPLTRGTLDMKYEF
jgi:hypothetical protein